MAGSVTSSPESGRYYVLPAVGAPLRREDRAVPAPGPGEALVRIDACGVCGSDAFLQKGGFGADKLPVVPGHEAAGHVVSVGDDADADWVGRQVAIYYISGPADSRWARAGAENIGPDIRRMGVDLDGAFRIVDGNSDGEPVVDMGAFEFSGPACAPADLDCDGAVNGADLGLLLAAWVAHRACRAGLSSAP